SASSPRRWPNWPRRCVTSVIRWTSTCPTPSSSLASPTSWTRRSTRCADRTSPVRSSHSGAEGDYSVSGASSGFALERRCWCIGHMGINFDDIKKKAQDTLSKNSDKVEQGLDKASGFAKSKFGDKADKIDDVTKKAKDAL